MGKKVIVVSMASHLEHLLKSIDLKSVDVVGMVVPHLDATVRDLAPLQHSDGMNINFSGRNFRAYSYSCLPNLIREHYFDYIIVCGYEDKICKWIQELGVDRSQILNVRAFYTRDRLAFAKSMEYACGSQQDSECIIVGDAAVLLGIDPKRLPVTSVNIAAMRQDLYYTYRSLNYVLQQKKKGWKYCIIGISPYSFRYNLSLSRDDWYSLTYYPVLKDLNHFHIKAEDIESIFNVSCLSHNDNLDTSEETGASDMDNLWHIASTHAQRMNEEIIIDENSRIREEKEDWSEEFVEENVHILLDCLNLCRINHIVPILVGCPFSSVIHGFPGNKELEAFYVILEQVKERIPVHFLDYFLDPYFQTNDFCKVDWLNLQGQEKLTKLLSDFLYKLEEGKIRVGFIMQNPNVWGSLQPIFEKMEKRSDIEVYGFLIPGYEGIIGPGAWGHYDKENEFFHHKYSNIIDAADAEGNVLDLSKYHLDYLFYQRPYDMQRPLLLRCSHTMRFTKTCYVEFAYAPENLLACEEKVSNTANMGDFLPSLYFYFADSLSSQEFQKHRYENERQKNLFLGYPPAEKYLLARNSGNKKLNFLWTPRWENTDCEHISHFLDYKDKFIDLHSRFREINMTIRPHPLMVDWLASIGYAEEWKLYRKKLERADIHLDETPLMEDALLGADILFSDPSSTAYMFFLTGRPVICQKRGGKSWPLSSAGKLMFEGMYWSDDWNDVENILSLLFQGKDPLREVREKIIQKFYDMHFGATDRIIEEIVSDYKNAMQ